MFTSFDLDPAPDMQKDDVFAQSMFELNIFNPKNCLILNLDLILEFPGGPLGVPILLLLNISSAVNNPVINVRWIFVGQT